ncbi:MAG: alkyl sulfatase dimerization domain-containing protein [Polyangiaceae bacterium]
MGRVLDLAEKLWSGEVSADDHPPYTPLLEMDPIADGVVFLSSFANVAAIATGDGLVLIDVGSLPLAPMVFSQLREWSKERVHTAVFTHGHLDHVMGIGLFDDEARAKNAPPPRVIAHEQVPVRFARYAARAGYNSCVNSRQFQMPIAWPTKFRAPDVLYAREQTLDVGGVAIELHHARGETDDHTWAWVPSKKLLCTGDLFLWCCPNAGNPQKVQRYPNEWACALRQMEALGAEVLSPGHGVPILGAARVKQALSETAELLELLHDRTLEMMNAGARLEDIVRSVKAPERLLARPYLHPVYDEPEFIVRNVWRLYGGWWDGDPSRLKPAPREALAHEIAELAGGAGKLAERAQALADKGELALACHLAELAGDAAPRDAAIVKTRADVYFKRSRTERSLMARGVYAAAATEPPKRRG